MTQYPYPVIVLPGIMGTSLHDEYPVSPETVWSPIKLLMKAFDRITLHPDDTRFELAEPARVVRDQLFEIAYSEFIEELRHNLSPQADEPVPVFPFAYDWRQPLESPQEALAQFIDEVIDRTRLLRNYDKQQYGTANFPAKVNLVGHSMGGLIIAGYLKKYGDNKVNKIATIAAPFRGSLEAVAKTATGVGALGPSTGSSRERDAARVTPSLYYLLPSFAGDVTADAGLSDDLFLTTAWQPGILDTLAQFIKTYGLKPEDPVVQAHQLLTAMLDAAHNHRSSIESLVFTDTKRWLSIVGLGVDTRFTMQITRDPQGQPWFDLSNKQDINQQGDGTVPYLGARPSFIPTEQVVCVSPDDFSFWELKDKLLAKTGLHSMLLNMDLVQRLVVSHFKNAQYGHLWGHPAPDLVGQWDPPISGLGQK